MKTNLRLMIPFLFCAACLSGCSHAESYQKPAKPVQAQGAQSYYPGGEPGAGERYSANILPSSQTELAFKYGGFLSEIHQIKGADNKMRSVQEGDIVGKGTALARLRGDDFAAKVEQAQAQLAEAQSAIETNQAQLSEAEAAQRQAERDLDRATKLLEARSLVKPEYENAKTRVELAQAKAEAVRAQRKVIEAKISGARAILNEAKLAQQDAALRAPMDCYVLKRMAEVGSVIAPGRPVFVVAERSPVKAVFGVPDLTAPKIKPGMALTLTAEAIPGAEFKGWISNVSPAADPRSRVFDVEVTIPQPPPGLRPGMIAALTLPTVKSSTPVTVIPINAIVRLKQSPETYAVNVVTEQGGLQVARQRPVKLGEAFGNMIAVTEGLKLGERVIVSGAALVVDGEQVKVIP
ncbi:MAG TPA: efflux RND transporter periplasmic adaptor subunit [Blastocatellia bacterium]|nr:efflux RND transporter periplasmic adaptor subunit [Blastocatellia bacterium]